MEMFHTHIGPHTEYAVGRVLAKRRLSEGPVVTKFEKELSKQLGLVNPVAVNSGTSALYLALRLAGVGPGDRVILPAVTFIATAAAILQCGAVPVFADVDPETGNICPESVTAVLEEERESYEYERLSGRYRHKPVKAIIAVHWLGLPCDLDELYPLAPLIQDAAHALGASYKDRPIGSWGLSAFSFQATKHLSTGDGGAVCSGSLHDEQRARKFRWFGVDRSQPVGPLGEREFELSEVGTKAHMNDVAAAIGLGNLDGFAKRLKKREWNWCYLRDEVGRVVGVTTLDYPSDRQSACYAFGLRVERRDDFARAMKERGVPCSVIASRIDKYGFPAVRRPLPGTGIFDSEFIALPCHEALTDDDIDTIIKVVREGW